MVNCLFYQKFGYEFEFRTSKYIYFDMSFDFPLHLDVCPPPPEKLREETKIVRALCARFCPTPEMKCLPLALYISKRYCTTPGLTNFFLHKCSKAI